MMMQNLTAPARSAPGRLLEGYVMSRTRFSGLLVAVALATAFAGPAQAQIPLGATAPNFTKSVFGGGTASLSQYSGKVVVLFLLGYD